MRTWKLVVREDSSVFIEARWGVKGHLAFDTALDAECAELAADIEDLLNRGERDRHTQKMRELHKEALLLEETRGR